MTRQKKIEISIGVGAVLLVACLIVPAMCISTVVARICPNCGAREYETRWLPGIVSDHRVEGGSLTEWLVAHHVAHNHIWCGLGQTERNVFGRGISAASSNPPPIVSVSSSRLADFLKNGQESEIESFVHAMTKGSQEEQAAAVRKLAN